MRKGGPGQWNQDGWSEWERLWKDETWRVLNTKDYGRCFPFNMWTVSFPSVALSDKGTSVYVTPKTPDGSTFRYDPSSLRWDLFFYKRPYQNIGLETRSESCLRKVEKEKMNVSVINYDWEQVEGSGIRRVPSLR